MTMTQQKVLTLRFWNISQMFCFVTLSQLVFDAEAVPVVSHSPHEHYDYNHKPIRSSSDSNYQVVSSTTKAFFSFMAALCMFLSIQSRTLAAKRYLAICSAVFSTLSYIL